MVSGEIYPLRRSRGYAPFPVPIPERAPPILAVGGELKNAFCLTREQHAFLSHHVGDLENYETLRSFEEGIAHYERLFRVTPAVLAYDLHPDYLATRYALARADAESLPAVGVQHHHAHIAAVMADRGHQGERPVIGVAFDGTGYGTDGAIWGGEFLIADYTHFERALHLAYVPLPGGDRAVKQPWRTALAWLAHSGLDWAADLPPVQAAEAATLEVMRHLLRASEEAKQPFAPPTSSMGRLFDAVAALAGVRQQVNYEGQAAIELEAHLTPAALAAVAPYPFELAEDIFDAAPLIRAAAADVRAGHSRMRIAARFHQGVAQLVLDGCQQLRRRYGVSEVALSGGVWQNMVLLRLAMSRLEAADFTVYVHQAVPANDGGLALGQSAIAAAQWENN
jgi:hydrogenase maturation protein HypF